MVASPNALYVLPRPLGGLAAACLALATLAACGGDTGQTDQAEEPPATSEAQAVAVADAGLATPESVLYDAEADVYFVSNINGAPLDKDDNGFISRVAPDGTILDLHWIDGSDEAIRLHAPKGLAIHGDTLFVADIDLVRAFDRTTGAYLGAREVPGASFLNDLTVDANGALWVSDTGLNPDFSSSGTDAVYRFDGDTPVLVTDAVPGPNGILAVDDGVLAVSFASADTYLIHGDGSGTAEVFVTLPGGQADGIVRMNDGSYLVSSWETQAVYRIPADGGPAEIVVEGVPSPADIGWDAQRQRVLIPVFQEDRLQFEPIG
jgi:sugar lactone lactonase YvrE